jgi:hypothetical protein
MAKKGVHGTRTTSGQRDTQNRGNTNREQRNSSQGQSRQGSEWREMDRQQNGGRGMDTRHAGGGRNMEDVSEDMGRGGNMGRRGMGRETGNRGVNRGSQGRGNFPMDNLTYNVVTILHEKSKGLEAFDRYMQDARGDELEDLLEEIRDQDERAIEELQDHLHRLLNASGRGRRVA